MGEDSGGAGSLSPGDQRFHALAERRLRGELRKRRRERGTARTLS
ncbi:hypothetical protein ACFPRL_12000 [Pseudoclavibacter helvolus]